MMLVTPQTTGASIAVLRHLNVPMICAIGMGSIVATITATHVGAQSDVLSQAG